MLKKIQSDIARLNREVEKLRGVTIARRGGLETRGSLSFGGELPLPQGYQIAPKTVVIIAQPRDGDAVLMCRAVRYLHNLPVPCVTGGSPPTTACYYVWDGEPFSVYPAFGMKPVDYQGDEFTKQIPDNPETEVVEGGPENPGYDTVFHRCTYQHGYWMMENAPKSTGGGIVPARVLNNSNGQPPSGTQTTIRVQPVKRSTVIPQPADPWLNDGDPIEAVPLWDKQQGQDFQTLVGYVIPLIVIGGERYAMQYFWFYSKNPSPSILKGDCGL